MTKNNKKTINVQQTSTTSDKTNNISKAKVVQQSEGKVVPLINEHQSLVLYTFNFIEKDYYKDCHCINVVNLLQYMGDSDSVNKLVPYLIKQTMYEHVKKLVNVSEFFAVRNILDDQCGYITQYLATSNMNFVVKQRNFPILYETPDKKIICIYQSQIFDATQHKTQTATIEAFKKLGGEQKNQEDNYIYFKLGRNKKMHQQQYLQQVQNLRWTTKKIN